MKAYYDARAPEYDEWYRGLGRFDELDRPQWDEDVRQLERTVAELPPVRTLDVACGTGFLTRHLRGDVVGLDQSARMLEVAREQAPNAELVQGDAFDLPFDDDSFDRVFTGHFYGHLDEDQRARFLGEARRVAPELVVVDSALRDDVEVARAIAGVVRERDGGFPGVRALGLALPRAGHVQVSMNVEDYEASALHEIFARVEAEAAARGVEVRETELVGLMPAGAAVAAAGAVLRIDGFEPSRVLELRMLGR